MNPRSQNDHTDCLNAAYDRLILWQFAHGHLQRWWWQHGTVTWYDIALYLSSSTVFCSAAGIGHSHLKTWEKTLLAIHYQPFSSVICRF